MFVSNNNGGNAIFGQQSGGCSSANHQGSGFGGLNNNQLYNIIPTWPAWLPAFMRVPIDHIFHSNKFGKFKYYKGLDAGSDHFPVFIDLELCK